MDQSEMEARMVVQKVVEEMVMNMFDKSPMSNSNKGEAWVVVEVDKTDDMVGRHAVGRNVAIN